MHNHHQCDNSFRVFFAGEFSDNKQEKQEPTYKFNYAGMDYTLLLDQRRGWWHTAEKMR